MEAVYFYLVFAVSGALTSMFSIWYPAYEVARDLEPDNIVIGMPKLYYALCFAFSFVLAPALIIIFLNQHNFIKAFVESLLGREDDN